MEYFIWNINDNDIIARNVNPKEYNQKSTFCYWIFEKLKRPRSTISNRILSYALARRTKQSLFALSSF